MVLIVLLPSESAISTSTVFGRFVFDRFERKLCFMRKSPKMRRPTVHS
jgi:hypothetical protein